LSCITNKISFEKVTLKHKDMLFQWLAEPHMQEFWDNSQEHKDDIINFINGRKEPSNYFDGIFTYWIGKFDGKPFCFILTAKVNLDDKYPSLWEKYFSKTGATYSLDFGIGNKGFLGQGLASSTLEAFTTFFKSEIDTNTDTFFIDPDENNPRARHVYAKAGFDLVGTYEDSDKAYWDFSGKNTCLMVKKIKGIK
jgi:RimJ/RimL family protein N-acetyltransferase